MSEKLEWQLIAKDEASATFEKVKRAQDDLAASSEKAAVATEKSNSGWKDVAKGFAVGTVAIQAAEKAFGFLKNVVVDSIKEASDFQKTQNQIGAALISTKGAAGVTQQELNNMAQELSNLTSVDDDVINSMQAMQLTFTNITKPIFKETSLAAIDMATAMSGGVTPSAEQLQGTMIQLGKAINDPTMGITALTRVGVTFTDKQKDQIKTLVDTGHTMEAQKMVLAELSREFGGSAAAAAGTYQGQMNRLQNAVGDVKKSIGQALLPTLTLFIGEVADNTGKLEINQGALRGWQLKVYEAGVIIRAAVLTIGNFIKIVWDMAQIVIKGSSVIMVAFKDMGMAVVNFGDHAKVVFEAIQKAMTGDFSGAFDTLKTDIKGTFSDTSIMFNDFTGQFGKTIGDIGKLTDPMAEAYVELSNPDAFNKLMAKMDETAKKAADAASGVAGPMADLSSNTKKETGKVAEALTTLKDKYAEVMGAGKTSGKISESLAKLEEDHTKTIEGIADKLKTLSAQLKTTEDDYKKATGEMNKSEAEKFVEQQQKIKDLKSKLTDEQAKPAGTEDQTKERDKNIKDLQDQIAKEQAALDQYSTRSKEIQTEITEATRRANETEFQRFMEDLKTKRAEAEADHKDKLQKLTDEIAQQELQAKQENVLYEGKKKQYQETQKVFQAFHDKYLTNLDSMKNATKKSVDDMNVKLKELTSILEQIESAKNKAGLLSSAGLSTTSDTTTANSQSNTAQGANNGSKSVIINLGGVTVQSQAQIDALVATITRQLQLAGVASQ